MKKSNKTKSEKVLSKSIETLQKKFLFFKKVLKSRFCQDFKLMVVCYFEALFAKSGFYIK